MAQLVRALVQWQISADGFEEARRLLVGRADDEQYHER